MKQAAYGVINFVLVFDKKLISILVIILMNDSLNISTDKRRSKLWAKFGKYYELDALSSQCDVRRFKTSNAFKFMYWASLQTFAKSY